MRIDSAIITGSFSVNGDSFNDLGSYSTTGSNTFVGNQSIVGAVSASAFTGSISYTHLTNVPTLVSGSEQIVGILSPLNSFTASNSTTNTFTSSTTVRLNALENTSASVDTLNTTQNTRLTNLENKTGSLAITGSNTFIGTQIFSGSVYVKENLIVQGSSSLQNITASAVDIGTNKIILNVNNPAVRYAGISVYDSGSTSGTGSLWWDSVNNYWLYEHPADSGAPYNSAILISGPKNEGNLGEEVGLTSNYIMKAVGGDHISSSVIYDDGTKVTVYNDLLFISSSGKVGIGTFSSNNYKLDVSGSGRFSSQLNVNTLLNLLKTDNSTVGAQLAYDSNANQLYLWTSISNGYFSIYTNSTERLTVTSGGNIGIGNNSPVRKVDIVSTGEQLRLSYDSGGTVYSDFRSDSAGGLLVNTSGGYIINYIGGSEKMRITSDGNIGIGTTTPKESLEIKGLYGNIRIYGRSGISNNTISSNIYYNGTSWVRDNGSYGAAYMTLSAQFGSIIFATTGSVSGDASERMRITSDGLVGIGTTTPDNTYQGLTIYGSNPSLRLKGSGASSWNWIEFVTSAGTNNFSMGVNQTQPYFGIKAGAGLDSPSFILNTSGNIGIGTTNPASKLDIHGGSIRMGEFLNSASSLIGKQRTSTGTFYSSVEFYSTSGEDTILFNTHLSGVRAGESMRIMGNGYVGINTTSPGQQLHIHNTSNYVGMLINGSNAPQLCFAQGVSTTPTWKVGISGNDGTAFSISSGTVNADRIVIGSSGRVAVGDSVSAGSQLAVGGALKVNRSIYNWYQSGTNSWDGYQYLHLKTGLYGGAAGNSMPTMSLFYARLYSYSSAYVREGHYGFHNWSGTIYNPSSSGTIWSGAYMSTDGYVVLVVALGGGSYMGVNVDYHQSFGYPFQDKYVSGATASNSSSGVY